MASSDLLEKIRGTFDDPEFSDCVIQVEDRTFRVSKLVLTVQSDVFAAAFRHDTVERKSGIIKIEEATPQLVETMLRFMYGEELENVYTDADLLFVLSDRYNVVKLKELCTQSMCNNLQMDTIFNYLSVAYNVDNDELKQKCLEFITEHEEEIRDNPEWIQLTDSVHQITRDLCQYLCKRLRQVEEEAQRRREELMVDPYQVFLDALRNPGQNHNQQQPNPAPIRAIPDVINLDSDSDQEDEEFAPFDFVNLFPANRQQEQHQAFGQAHLFRNQRPMREYFRRNQENQEALVREINAQMMGEADQQERNAEVNAGNEPEMDEVFAAVVNAVDAGEIHPIADNMEFQDADQA